MKIALLIDHAGQSIANPVPKEGTISWNQEEGRATAWGPDERTCIAELHNARPVWITHRGIRLEGFEPVAPGSPCYRAQQWQVSFE